MSPFKIGVIVLLAFVLQTVFTVVQIKSYQKKLSQMMKRGKVTIGREKGMISSGCVVLLRVDDQFEITEAQYMKGMTVFNRFKEFPDLVGKNTLDSEKWMIEIKNKRVKNAVDNAIENMYAALKNKDEEVCI